MPGSRNREPGSFFCQNVPEMTFRGGGEQAINSLRTALDVGEMSRHPQAMNVLITAGPTREPLDPVRFLSNRSSGKMGDITPSPPSFVLAVMDGFAIRQPSPRTCLTPLTAAAWAR